MKKMNIWQLLKATEKKLFEASAEVRTTKRETINIRIVILQNWLRNLYIDGVINLNDYQEAEQWVIDKIKSRV